MGLTKKLIEVIEGRYSLTGGELNRLIEAARMNKILLGFLRRANISTGLRRIEEIRYAKYMNLVKEVADLLNDLNYALYKFRKPIEHVSVDIDILIDKEDIDKALDRLLKYGFKPVVIEPYTATLQKDGIPIDLYTQPAFAWVIYLDGEDLLRHHVEVMNLNGVEAKVITKDAEVISVASHAVYKEHIYLLADYFTIKKWMDSKAVELAKKYNVKDSLAVAIKLNEIIDSGIVEAPIKLDIPLITKTYINKFIKDNIFRATSINLIKYIRRGGFGKRLIDRIIRKTY